MRVYELIKCRNGNGHLDVVELGRFFRDLFAVSLLRAPEGRTIVVRHHDYRTVSSMAFVNFLDLLGWPEPRLYSIYDAFWQINLQIYGCLWCK